MTAKRGTPKYQAAAAAISSVCKRILERSDLGEPELERQLGIEDNDGKTFLRYLRGEQVPPEWKAALFVRNASSKRWLTVDELGELGLAFVAHRNYRLQLIAKNRESALRLFLDGRDNILAGLLPMRVHDGRFGYRNRPGDEAEQAVEFQRWWDEIARLGGSVTSEQYRRKPTAADLAKVEAEAEAESRWQNLLDRQWRAQEEAGERNAREFLRGLELGKHDDRVSPEIRATIRDALTRALDGAAAADEAALEEARIAYLEELDAEEAAACPSPPLLPAYHPDNVRHLDLWFGGRSYSERPCRLLEEHELSGYAVRPCESADFAGFVVMVKARKRRTKERAKEAEKSHRRKQRRVEARRAKMPAAHHPSEQRTILTGAKVAQ